MTDPRTLNADSVISLSDAPGETLIDTRHAVLLDTFNAYHLNLGQPAIALELAGRINTSPDTARILTLTTPDDAARIAAGLIEAAIRLTGQAALDIFTAAMQEPRA